MKGRGHDEVLRARSAVPLHAILQGDWKQFGRRLPIAPVRSVQELRDIGHEGTA